MFGKLISCKTQGQKVIIQFEQGTGWVEVLTERIFHVGASFSAQSVSSKAIEGEKNQDIPIQVEVKPECIIIKTKEVTAKVYDEFKVDFYGADGKARCLDYRGRRVPAGRMSLETKALMEQEGHKAEDEGQPHKIEVVKAMEGDEVFYGLGDKIGFLNKRHYCYEMWNTDNPEPQVENFKMLYKTIPFFITKKEQCVYGLFFDNTYRSYFDMGKESDEYFYYGVDDGDLNYYYIAGDTMPEVLQGYACLTGTVPLPQLWTLGYHQSRWGYEWESGVRQVAEKMRECQIPCDVIHLDIDYMDHFKVFTWNPDRYDDPKKMIGDLKKNGFKVVTIIDPGVKKEEGYSVYEEGVENGYFVTTLDGKIYSNYVWPGEAVFPDFGNSKVREWWADKQKFLADLGVRGVWNDMNEPASFHGEIPQDVVFTDEGRVTDHKEMHNVYGHLMAKATYEGLKKHDGRRPFLITRACYSGTQKYSTAWTGDNHSLWGHLQAAIPQICNLGLSGMPYVGTDVGGFGSDTTAELLCRWVQVGCFSPLFRNHSATGTRFQEPWAFDEMTLEIYRKYVQLRYRLLPYFYDLFHEAEKTGMPIMRPPVLHYEDDKTVQNLNDQFMVGSHMIVAPVVGQGETHKMVYLPKGQWIDFWTGEKIEGEQWLIKEAPLDICPIYVQAGSILPNYPLQQHVGEKEISELKLDIYEGEGSYIHYQDDGESFDYQRGIYNQYQFTIKEDGTFRAEMLHEGYFQKYKGFELHYQGKNIKVLFDGQNIQFNLNSKTV